MSIIDLLRDDPWGTMLDIAWLTAPIPGVVVTASAVLAGLPRVARWFAVLTATQAVDVIAETWLYAPRWVAFVLRLGFLVLFVPAVVVFIRSVRRLLAQAAAAD